MSENLLTIDIAAWVERAKNAPVTYKVRQVTEVVLNAIAHTSPLNKSLFLKGGVLMGIAYDSPRTTTDIDLTTSLEAGKEAADQVRALLDGAFPQIIGRLGYAGLILKVHSVTLLPKKQFDTAEFPAIKLKVGYADQGTAAHEALKEGRAAATIEVDISFNEPQTEPRILAIPGGAELLAYSLTDLMAEKLRAMLQQVTRKRNRRQDVYDLYLLINTHEFSEPLRKDILASFSEKATSRHLKPTKESLSDPEVRRRSGADWDSLKLEVPELPDFDACFECVQEFYRSLPWP